MGVFTGKKNHHKYSNLIQVLEFRIEKNFFIASLFNTQLTNNLLFALFESIIRTKISYVQQCQLEMAPLLSKYYQNRVTLSGDKIG